ncbi:response regulator transcription factor [Marinibactrum halimedae]|uniref:DNA-binding response regulator n=1 Tax=Marinibactrum halimedae TaxID=1444977 RepID=A0AA37T370_9GAMM|nr:response regulator [Marinibactrum halimedae]MCD9460261.1 response regulator [Marinibactrum halimedae]GLS24347.1 DNA-binding response regulator [Marinibactrum halimedae]
MSAILLVDDDVIFLEAMARALAALGYDPIIAEDEPTALATLAGAQERGISVTKAVVDLRLAASSGLHLIPQLKGITPQLDIILLTGYSSIATAVEAIKLGAKDYLCKPADAHDVIAAFKKGGANPNIDIPVSPPSVNRLEWEHIQKVLTEHEGNISATARALGMHRRTLQRKLQKRPVKS